MRLRERWGSAELNCGSLTLHPGGLPHGPHPGKLEESIGMKRTDELAVMLDRFRPLQVGQGLGTIEDADYAQSWVRQLAK